MEKERVEKKGRILLEKAILKRSSMSKEDVNVRAIYGTRRV